MLTKSNMNKLLLSLSVLLVITTAAQAQFSGCFTNDACTVPLNGPLSGPISAEDCCVNSAGTYISFGGQCLQCIVYGWGASSFSKPENQIPHEVPLAYSKGPANVLLIVDIIDTGEGTASNDDYTENENTQILLSLDPIETTSVTFRPDNFALEPDETIVFDLDLIAATPGGTDSFNATLPNVFFQRRTVLSIQDSTELIFRLREVDRAESEDSGNIEVVVGVANQRDLASPISLVLTPRVAEENFDPPPDTLPFAQANTHQNRIDFIADPITLNFSGNTRELTGEVPIIDDNINEALEFFRVDLTFADPASVPATVSIGGSGVIRLDIVDNDDVFIGFELPETTYPEVEDLHQVTLIKGAGNVTEQEIIAVVNLVQSVPPGTSFDVATPSEGDNDNDLNFGSVTNNFAVASFPPDVDEITIQLTIFGDELPEDTEAAQLTLEIPTDEFEIGVAPPRFEILPEFPSFFIIISDDDRFLVGFETLSYTINEGVRSQQVCIRMFEPSDDTTITGTFLVGVETIADSADESDYTATSGFSVFITFNNMMRRSCVEIFITDDTVYENEERFFLQLTDLPGFALSNNFVLSPNISEINILDNEMVTVGFIDVPYSAREDEGPMIFTVGVTSGHTLARNIDLSFSTADIAIGGMFAVAGLDYTAISDLRFTLTPGMMTFQIPVDLVNDNMFEQNELFRGELTLVSGERVTVGEGIANATIIEDEIVCQELELLENGRIEYSPNTTAPYLEGTNAEHICNPGFFLIGNVIRVCQNDSTFSGVPPMCTPIQCLPLSDIENGNVQYAPDNAPDYDLETVATYTCDDGFVLDFPTPESSATRTCIDDNDNDAEGVFDREAPICIPIQCPELRDILNGSISYAEDTVPDFDLGTIATYMCDEGFFLIGDEERNCTEGVAGSAMGMFSGTEPICVPIQCDLLPTIENGVISYSPDMMATFDLGTIANYTCNEGFVLEFPDPESSEVRECIDDEDNDAEGIFDRDAPICVPIQCLPLPDFENGVITYNPDSDPNFPLGTSATYSCNQGFFLEVTESTNRVRTCEDDDGMDAIGVFSGQEPRCIPIECLPLSDIANGVITYATDMTANYSLGTVATYACNQGFFLDTSALNASATRMCIDDMDNDALGIFDRQAPVCVPVDCMVLPDFPNGVIFYATDMTPDFDLMTTATYSCDEGYFLDLSNGDRVRTCIDDDDNDADGEFTGQAPECVLIECLPLDDLENGMISYGPDMTANYILGTNATYSCNEGFFLDLSVGDYLRTCIDEDGDAEGEFDGIEPTCIPIQCVPLPSIENGIITYATDTIANYDLGTIATYSCNQGFFLDTSAPGASATRECIDDMDNDAEGIFNRQAPECVPVECLPLTDIPNGVITYGPDMTADYMLGTVATYTCNQGFFLNTSAPDASATRTCIDDADNDAEGIFDRQPPQCVPVVCEPLEDIINGMITYDPDVGDPNFMLGTNATYSCNEGYFLEVTETTNVVRTCEDDLDGDSFGEFSGRAPRCVLIECDPLPDIPNGVITYGPDTTADYMLGTVATYMCNDGFFLDTSGADASVTRTCIDDMNNDAEGIFDRQPPVCVPVDCMILPPFPNGTIAYATDMTPDFDLLTTATYSCDEGYFLDLSNGDRVRTCIDDDDNDADGEFTGQAPECVLIECEPLPGIPNGVITYGPDTTADYMLGTVATYSCNEGFTLDISNGGSETRICTDDLDSDADAIFNNQAPECVRIDITVNDTVSGDPLYTVPLNVPDKSEIMNVGEDDPINLCFEVHGDDGALLNLVSDACVSVNARYARVRPDENINIVDRIYIRATDSDGVCHNIEVSLDQCSASVDDVAVSDYASAGISVRQFRERVRIVVPNCADIDLVMWVQCINTTFWSRTSTDENEVIFHARNIRFVIARGLDLAERSHGLLGQFWNVPIRVEPYTGLVEDEATSEGYYVITTNHPNEPPRSFVGWLWPLTWEYRMEYCLYAGQYQAGPLFEILDDNVNNAVIFGEYGDYRVASPYATAFNYSHFEEDRCMNINPL